MAAAHSTPRCPAFCCFARIVFAFQNSVGFTLEIWSLGSCSILLFGAQLLRTAAAVVMATKRILIFSETKRPVFSALL